MTQVKTQSPQATNLWVYWIFKNLLYLAFTFIYNIRIYKRERVPMEGPVLLVSNHQSFMDPVICGIGIKRDLDYMARETLFRGIFGRLLNNLNAFPINRDETDMTGLRLIVNRLKLGRATVMFPEGTRSDDGTIKDFKGGFYLIARRANATTIPVAIEGSFEAWSRHQKLPGAGQIRVMYGKPIKPEQAKSMTREEYTRLIKKQMFEMHNELRRQAGRKPIDYRLD